MSQPQPVRSCQQVLTNGHLCKCPAMRTSSLCYYHHRDLQRRHILEQARDVKRSYDKKRESRTEDEFDSEVVEALDLPALDDRASIQVACTNIMRAVYCNHISPAKARIMMRAVTEANLCLRRGDPLNEFRQPVIESDPHPIARLGDEDGCILPEERVKKNSLVKARREEAARLDAEIAAARARGEDPPPRPLTPEEEKEATLEAHRAENDLALRDFWQGALAHCEPDSMQERHARNELALVDVRISTRKAQRKTPAHSSQPVLQPETASRTVSAHPIPHQGHPLTP